MNITQSYVSLFFWLGSCRLGLKVFHWERKFCLFLISAVFSILEVYMYLNSVLLVFLFLFCFFVFFLPRGQAWVVWFQKSVPGKTFVSKRLFEFQELCYEDTRRTFPSEGHFPWPSTEAMLNLQRVLNGQCSARYPCLIRLLTRLPHIKREKNEKKNLKHGYLVSCTVAICSSKIKLCTNFGPDS